ncbi:MAG: hypothetical protein ACXAC5_00645 [Promethearchaeota archaeon]
MKTICWSRLPPPLPGRTLMGAWIENISPSIVGMSSNVSHPHGCVD